MYASTYAKPVSVATARPEFLRNTYAHVAGAVLLFALFLTIFVGVPALRDIGARVAVSVFRGFTWLLVVGGLIVVSMFSQRLASPHRSRAAQYAGLAIYVLFEALIFWLLLALLAKGGKFNVVVPAALISLGLFLGLSAIPIITKRDFSFLRGFVAIGFFVLLGVVLTSVIIGFHIGTLGFGLIVLFMGVCILYYTSMVMREFPDGSHVGAALLLVSSFFGLLWHVIQLLLSLSSDN